MPMPQPTSNPWRWNRRPPRSIADSPFPHSGSLMGALTIHLVMAARPNFMKIAPLYHLLKRDDWCVPVLVHTGQHYDAAMSDWFLRDLGLPTPDIHLGVGSGSH